MEYHHLPPPPDLRLFTKGDLKVASLYSNAGISSSFFISTPQGSLLVDAGDGALRDMIELARLSSASSDDGMDQQNKGTDDLTGALITHGHYDHCAGLLSILAFLQLMGRTSPFVIAGPERADYLWSLLDLFEGTLWERCPFPIERVKLSGEGELHVGPYRVLHMETDHRDSRPGSVGGRVHSLSYRVEREAASIFFSGDCSDIASLKQLARDASLAVVEATFPVEHRDQGGVHLTVEEAMELGGLAGEMWLVHLTAASAKHIERMR